MVIAFDTPAGTQPVWEVGSLEPAPGYAPRPGWAVLGTEGLGEVRGLKALVVDDRSITRAVLGGLLMSLGVQPVLVPSAEAGLHLLREAGPEHPFHLVLMDLGHAGRDGFEALGKVRGELPDPLPAFLLILGHGDTALRRRAQGFGRILAAPFSPSGLLDAILAARKAEPRPVG